MKKIVLLFLMATLMACNSSHTFTESELDLIGNSADAGIMAVLQTTDETDSLLLRQTSASLTPEDLRSASYSILKARMLATVNDPEHPGVGIAAPQVGIRRNLVAVQRFDKEGEPFEFYANPVIEVYGEQTQIGMEGCLSIPDRSEAVNRSQSIVLSYLDETTGERIRERVEGFTAVIFQHEVDHLNGILYVDRMVELPSGSKNCTEEV